MCTADPSFWKKDELLFPDRGPIQVGCSADGTPHLQEVPKYHEKGQQCPFDRRLGTKDETSHGCFFHCRVFTPNSDAVPTRAVALHLYEIAIKKNTKKEGA